MATRLVSEGDQYSSLGEPKQPRAAVSADFVQQRPRHTPHHRIRNHVTRRDPATRPRSSAGYMIGAPGAWPRPVVPGVRRTPGRLCGGDAPGRPDPPPRAGYRTPYTNYWKHYLNF